MTYKFKCYNVVEESLAKKFGPQRNGWQLFREGEILHHHQNTFVPDFTFRHEDGTEVLLEIVGFWTPEYLAHKRKNLTAISASQDFDCCD